VSETDEQFKRIEAVFNTSEIPNVSGSTVHQYFEYLKANLTYPCTLTGIESMGHFGWEERFEFGYGSKSDYQRLRRERGSYQDQYELLTLENAVVYGERDVLVKVERKSPRKRFEIPLSELQAVDEESDNYQLLDDYSVWCVNW